MVLVMNFISLISALFTCALAAPTSPWSAAVRAVMSGEQTWSRHVGRRTGEVFSIGCTAYGPAQSTEFVDTPSAVTKWFSETNVGETCAVSHETHFTCVPATQPQQTACSFDGALAVWNTEPMDCFAFEALQSAVEATCLDSTDCGCGVYKFSGENFPPCLIATFTFHLSGLAIFNSAGFVGEPISSNVTVNNPSIRRDSLGPSYDDLTVCAFNNNGDVTRWCEGAGTQIC